MDPNELYSICQRLSHLAGAELPPERPSSDAEALQLIKNFLRQAEHRHLVPIGSPQKPLHTLKEPGQILEELGRLERLKTEFLQNITHELRTPLASIKGYAAALMQGMGKDEATTDPMPRETRKRFLQTIANEAARLSELIEEVLYISLIESRPLNHSRMPMRIFDLFVAALANFRSRWGDAAADRVSIVYEPEALIPDGLTVYANRDAVLEILRHLLDNAQKFSSPSPITLGARQLSESKGKRILIWVKDQGVGIPKSEQMQLFTKFHRIESTARSVPGTGLGLAITRMLAEQNGGQITVESELGAGATFKVLLHSENPNPPVIPSDGQPNSNG